MTERFHITTFFNRDGMFNECIAATAHGIAALGHSVTRETHTIVPNAINVVIAAGYDGAWRKADSNTPLIIYNWEQMLAHVPWLDLRYFRQMSRSHVWDYSRNNVEILRSVGISDAHHVPLGYAPEMNHIEPASIQDIDVLFYGNISPRRGRVIASIRELGLNVITSDDVGAMSGAVRDSYIARSKIVLNVRGNDDGKNFEIARVSYLLANAKAVVAEVDDTTEIDDDIRHALAGAPIDQLPALCVELIQDNERRYNLEQKAFTSFANRDASKLLAPAINRFLMQYRATPPRLGNSLDLPTALPKEMHIGAGLTWHFNRVNIDARADFAPDLCLDLSQPLPDAAIDSWRFGRDVVPRNYFSKITANYYFQRVDNLKQALTNCLELLEDGGVLDITIPLNLSLQAWTHIDDQRCFTEKSLENIINDWASLGWATHRFEIAHIGYGCNNANGMSILQKNGNNWDEALNHPRAIDTQNLILRKRPLTTDEVMQRPQHLFMD